METIECARCGRRLKDPNATYGPICARKMAAEQGITDQPTGTVPVTIRDGYAGMRTTASTGLDGCSWHCSCMKSTVSLSSATWNL